MGLDTGRLIQRLNKTCLAGLQNAAGLCVSKTNASIELEHWLLKILEQDNTDLGRILAHYEIDPSRFQKDVTAAVDRLKTGHNKQPTLSPSIDAAIREAWLLASVQYGEGGVRSGHLALAIASNDRLRMEARDISREFAGISPDALIKALPEITKGTVEDAPHSAPAGGDVRSGDAPSGPRPGSKTPALDQYTNNLTERARKGKIDPVLGRESEVRQMVDILIRRRQNNPILTGEAGVGKTAVVEGFALRVAQGDVPPALRDVEVCTLDLGLLQAGAGVKGEFENRLKQVIEEVKSSPKPIILFIDEAHTMIGAGGAAGQNDAANLLKPALARGELRTIAATTWAEYKKYFEKDAALARRFQVVKVEEPDEPKAVVMMRGVAQVLEQHHGVRILDEAVEASVRYSARYITGRQLPDKSLSLLDTACARVAIGQSAIPPAIEDTRKKIAALEVEIAVLRRESATGARHDDRLAEKVAQRDTAQAKLVELERRWDSEKILVESIKELRAKIEAGQGGDGEAQAGEDLSAVRAELEAKSAELAGLQGEDPLMQVCVDSQTIAEVVSGWTGIPAGRMQANEIQAVLNLRSTLAKRVLGQDDSLEAIGQRIRTSRAGLTDPRRPIGVFLLVGPSGVGKTETALSLAETLYGGERNLITINMSEYQEAHTVSSLKGSPPGYVGYGEGGVLTEAVRRKPYSVVLLDEIEKAHPDVAELFFQVFDKGVLEDGEGREIDFKNTVILLTSNVGTDLTMKLCADPETAPGPEALAEALRPELEKNFKLAFLGRMAVVPYYPISDRVLREIIRLQLGRIEHRVRDSHKAAFRYTDAVVESIAGRCTEVSSGARNVDHILTRTLLPTISGEFLGRMASGEPIAGVTVDVDGNGGFSYKFD